MGYFVLQLKKEREKKMNTIYSYKGININSEKTELTKKEKYHIEFMLNTALSILTENNLLYCMHSMNALWDYNSDIALRNIEQIIKEKNEKLLFEPFGFTLITNKKTIQWHALLKGKVCL